jgi:hypothetical protein
MTPWQALASELGGEIDDRGHLHLQIEARRFTLMRTALGAGEVVAAHASVFDESRLSPFEAAHLAAGWPVGALVLLGERWVLRHTFAGIPSAAQVTEILRFLAVQLGALRRRRPPVSPALCLAHYAE